MIDKFLTHNINGVEILEIKKGYHYAVPSTSEEYIYRNVEIFFDNQEAITLKCDCMAGYYRNTKIMCKHKKLVLPVVLQLAREGYFTQ